MKRAAALVAGGLVATCAREASAEPGVHDGFYLGVGPSMYAASLAQSRPSNRHAGLVEGFTLTIGGTPMPGLVVAGELASMTLQALNGRRGGRLGDDAAYSRVGVTGVWYPRPRGGWFVDAGLGVGSLSLGTWPSAPVTGDQPTWSGPAGHAGLGRGVFVSDEVSIAARLRVDAASMSPAAGQATGDTRRFSLLAASLAVVVALH